MRICYLNRLALAAATTLTLGIAGSALGQLSEYYLHSGDQDTFTVVQNGSILRQWNLAPGTDRYQYPMVVRDTVRTMGADVGDIGADYSLTGVDLGPRYTHPEGTSRCWDGATDGTHNYSIDTAGVVWQFDGDWTNPLRLFTAGGIGALAYDTENDTLWVGTFSGSNLTQYDLSGNIISSFTTGHTKNMAVAIDPADGTLWIHDRNRQGTLEQWSRSGSLLNTVVVPGLETQNALAGEFQFGGGGYSLSLSGQCPGTIRVTWNNAPPQTQQGIVFARNTGSFVIPNGPCQGTQLGLGTSQLQLVNTVATGNGSGSVNGQAGTGACGGYLQLVAVESPCETSNVAQLP
ncbi:MAG: hypothetical protein IT430_13660 [Phycisphaerales bacterium]|nr:hypothetical protein [Phycisphaerales bacterium]